MGERDLNIKHCPNCGSAKIKDWKDLDEDQKFLVERLPLNTEFSKEQRKKHRFCVRCFFEITDQTSLLKN